ncbi:3-methyladenine DNA glycosylase [Kutzneria sp. NPDC052558]|uniref:3-methyladenine DNA glycosylase n=1 Tax=Kutzneria sp. NPDC052558 TaxID=3364121 RepID=UPI0037C7BAF7
MDATTVLAEPEWLARQRAHVDRVRRWTQPHRERSLAKEKHPVHDFLFTYYSQRPGRLERWHPGLGVVLAGDADEFLDYRGYHRVADGVTLDPAACTEARVRTAEFYLALLTATAARPPRLNCFGLHEWAMVYRQTPEQVRHFGWPLRLGHQGTDELVEASNVRCGHFDAFRFFTPPARPRNALQPTRESQVELEQPGCLHGNMDLYKVSYKMEPYVPSELVADCFELASRIRELDMKASPYDLSALGYEPVRIEDAAGRAEYACMQAAFADQAAPLRERLIACCRATLTFAKANAT